MLPVNPFERDRSPSRFSSTRAGICFDIDSAEVSDSMIVERSPLPGLSAVSDICDVEGVGNGGTSGESRGRFTGTINQRTEWSLK